MDQQPSTDKETLAVNIDAIVLLGRAVGELSRLRQEQIKPALKAEFHSLCSQANKLVEQSFRPAFWGQPSKAGTWRQRY